MALMKRVCPICRKAVNWDTNPHRPFCSERCKTRDLAAWSSEDYRIPEKPDLNLGEGWSEGNIDDSLAPFHD